MIVDGEAEPDGRTDVVPGVGISDWRWPIADLRMFFDIATKWRVTCDERGVKGRGLKVAVFAATSTAPRSRTAQRGPSGRGPFSPAESNLVKVGTFRVLGLGFRHSILSFNGLSRKSGLKSMARSQIQSNLDKVGKQNPPLPSYGVTRVKRGANGTPALQG